MFLTLEAAVAQAAPVGTQPAPGFGSVMLRVGMALLLILAAAFFVAAESGLTGVRRARIEALAAGGGRRARWAERVLQRLDHFAGTARLGAILATLALGWLAYAMIAGMVGGAIRSLHTPFDAVTTQTTAVVLAFVVVVYLHVVLGVLVPRALGRLYPETAALWTAGPLLLLSRTAAPFAAVVRGSATLVLRAVGLTAPHEREHVHEPEELELLLTRTYEHGLLREDPVEMIRGVFGLAETTAAEIMTPRTSVVAIAAGTSVADAAAFILEDGHSRYPVFDDTIDHIVGVVLARDVWRAQVDGLTELRAIMRAPFFVPDTKPVEQLLREMRRERAHLAIVIDEFGGTAGIVTIEDVVEEIVGEIEDELDEVPADLEHGPEGEVLMSGGFGIADLNERYDLELPNQDYTTVGGFVLGRLGRVARVGDTVAIRGGTLRVLEMDARRVARLALFLEPAPPEEPVAEEEEWE